jgi:sulfur-carrier protein adenylyltransferase/sulfurtransferase
VDVDAFSVILDVRPQPSATAGFPRAVHVGIEGLLADPGAVIPTNEAAVLVVCDIGRRSALVADRLTDAGFSGVRSLEGGVDAWRTAGRPLISTSLSSLDAERYDRQVKLREIGVDGQQRLSAATVAVVGAGGLGVPAASYLAAAGVGTLVVIDHDRVELSNLHRQPMYTVDDVGRLKVEAVATHLAQLNPSIITRPVAERLDAEQALTLLDGADVVIDATDRFDARYAISDAAHALGVPVVTGAVYRWEGQLTVLAPDGPCYRCIFPTEPTGVELDCGITGVVGPVVGTMGAMQATEAIKLITGAGLPITGRLILHDGLTGTETSVRVSKRVDCPTCG